MAHCLFSSVGDIDFIFRDGISYFDTTKVQKSIDIAK